MFKAESFIGQQLNEGQKRLESERKMKKREKAQRKREAKAEAKRKAEQEKEREMRERAGRAMLNDLKLRVQAWDYHVLRSMQLGKEVNELCVLLEHYGYGLEAIDRCRQERKEEGLQFCEELAAFSAGNPLLANRELVQEISQ